MDENQTVNSNIRYNYKIIIILVLKQYDFKVDVNFKIPGFPLTLTLTPLNKTDILM